MADRPQWRLIQSEISDGCTNMAVDEAMLLALQQGRAPATLRIYAWRPPCLSIGCFQPAAEIDVEACAAQGADWVRRVTGGRAILHDREVTYSVVARQDDARVAGDVMESYRRISLGLLAGLELLGVPAQMAPFGLGIVPNHGPKPAACFAAPSQHEILVDGRKIIGSAQRRQSNVLLQHGSLLQEIDVAQLLSLLRLPNAEARQALADQVRRESITLHEILGHSVPHAQAAQALAQGYAQALDIDLAPGQLTPWELEEAARLRREKYTAHDWRYRK